ncbi:MAG: tRNA (N(6)-L-threonylcarbamoyladenosine(37)-C(2))-methylthiotransferase MtaB [Rhodospirillaceae bacterium]|jgi:threonylcarbamoyladenosine tRNA methylthiotransferase MtaB|nr:tRNA (N(6)-L-threonylcarbamoyladenosine(37)-C(2))-methylthiotransferase MtaB [Rhodospirillaceae bacterium]
MAAPDILTFGCRLNAYESEIMRSLAAGRDDIVIVNTCAVTKEAERQARQAIRRTARERPGARIVVTGCAAQIDPDRFAAMPEVAQVLGNVEKLDPKSWAPEADGAVLVGDIMAVTETAGHLIDGFGERARAFVQVQTGCDHRCTFCIIPFGRGPSRSVPMGRIAEQTRRLVEAGYREVVLTGVDMTAYGADLSGRPNLGQMVRRLLAAVPELPRLRLSSLDAVEIDADLMALFGEEERLMPHLHLSLQAGDDMILKRMKRRHSRADAVTLCAEIRRRRPDTVFGADLIAGFPTETDEMAENSLRLIEDCGLTHLHVFPFSARPGTPAARMPQVPGDLRKARAARLRQAGEAAFRRHLDDQVGRIAHVLVEEPGFGRSEHYAPVRLGHAAEASEIAAVRVAGVRDGELIAAAA